MAKTLRGLREGFGIDDLAEVVWDPDGGRTPSMLEVPQVLELGTQVVKARRLDPDQMGFAYWPDTWPSYPHLSPLWQSL